MDTAYTCSREELEEREEKHLAGYAFKSKDSKTKATDARTVFHHDQDIIYHSEANDRLQHKSQVFPSYYHDHFRTRKTHTDQVKSIAKDLCLEMKLNHELAQAIAMGHDLGHTPFGHKGEDILDAKLKEHGLKDGFDHNWQSFRICKKLGLSEESLEGLLKHESPWDPNSNRYKGDGPKPLLEAQIVDLADEIAYTSHDLKDGLKAGILKLEEVEKLKLWQRAKQFISKEYEDFEDEVEYISGAVSAMIKVLIQDVKSASVSNLKRNKTQNVEDVRNAEEKLITHSNEILEELNEARNFLYENLYISDTVVSLLKIADHIIGPLFDFYLENPDEMQPHYKKRIVEGDKNNNLKVVRDYVAGMTDRFAIDEALSHNIITQQEVDEMSKV
jgi:dGTPase